MKGCGVNASMLSHRPQGGEMDHSRAHRQLQANATEMALLYMDTASF